MVNKSTQKSGPVENNLNSGSITNIISVINSAFKLPSKPIAPLPPPLIVLGGNLRPGLSPREIAAKIISRQSQAGVKQGDIFSSSNNKAEAMELIRVEEIINSFLLNSKVDVAIPPGVPVTVIGVGNMGAPVISQGATTSFAIGNGIIR